MSAKVIENSNSFVQSLLIICIILFVDSEIKCRLKLD